MDKFPARNIIAGHSHPCQSLMLQTKADKGEKLKSCCQNNLSESDLRNWLIGGWYVGKWFFRAWQGSACIINVIFLMLELKCQLWIND